MSTRIERDRLRAAKRAVIEARKKWREHRQHCRNCTDFNPTRVARCVLGWSLLEDIRDARKVRDQLERTEVPGQATLF